MVTQVVRVVEAEVEAEAAAAGSLHPAVRRRDPCPHPLEPRQTVQPRRASRPRLAPLHLPPPPPPPSLAFWLPSRPRVALRPLQPLALPPVPQAALLRPHRRRRQHVQPATAQTGRRVRRGMPCRRRPPSVAPAPPPRLRPPQQAWPPPPPHHLPAPALP